MGITVVTGKDGIWLKEVVLIDIIKKKKNKVFDFQSIILG